MTVKRFAKGRCVGRALLIGALLPGVFGVAASSVRAVEPEVAPDAATGTVDVRVASGMEDVEEVTAAGSKQGTMRIKDPALDLGSDSKLGSQLVGIRFTDVSVPPGATITSARIEFSAEQPGSLPTTLKVRAEAAPNSAPFTATSRDLSRRSLTSASVKWSVETWKVAGAVYRTVDLSKVVQEVVSQQGWVSGNALSFVIDGTGRRVAKSHNRSRPGSPKLIVEYSGGTPTTQPPTFDPNFSEPFGYAEPRDLAVLNGKDWSGLSYYAGSNPKMYGLWAVNDESMLGHIEVDSAGQPMRTYDLSHQNRKPIDAEGVTVGGDDAVYVAAEARSKLGTPNGIYRYDVSQSGGYPQLTDTWSFGNVGQANPLAGSRGAIADNLGMEAVAFIPDRDLAGISFDGVVFNGSGTAMNGVFAIGFETDSTIYLVALDRSSASAPARYRQIGKVKTTLPGVMALEWDGAELLAYCDDACDKKATPGKRANHLSVVKRTGTPASFVEVGTFPTSKPAEGQSLEGFAVEPQSNCDDDSDTRFGWFTNDGKPVRSLYQNYVGRCPYQRG